MVFLSGLVGCFSLKFKINLKRVDETATKALTGTASFMVKPKKISIIGILLPAPERPPALERVTKIIIKTSPTDSKPTFYAKGLFSAFTPASPLSSGLESPLGSAGRSVASTSSYAAREVAASSSFMPSASAQRPTSNTNVDVFIIKFLLNYN